MLPQFESVRTTVTIPVDLIDRSQRFVEAGKIPSRNALIIAALEDFLDELERQEIDRQFELMADDADYQALNEKVAEEFADSDWQALSEVETK